MNKIEKTKQVIVGNSAAALSALKAIREVEPLCPITLISKESCEAYSPVTLTYYLKGWIPREDLFIVNSDFYEMHHVETLLGNEATVVDPLLRMVRLKNGKNVEYDNLLIATGASPSGLEISGDGLNSVFFVRTMKDAENILKFAQDVKDIIVIGAGLIGLQVSDALFREKYKFTIIERSKQVLPELIDADCSAILQKEIEAHGITVLLKKRIKIIEKTGKKATVISDSGEELNADMVIIGIGIQSNTSLVNDSNIMVNRGILVDNQMRTNINNIFAAGDVSEGENLITGKKEVIPTWSNACRQGRVAGLNMAGCEYRYEGGFKETITTMFGFTVASIGLTEASEGNGMEELKLSNPSNMSYRKIILADNRVIGAILLGRTTDAGILSNFIGNRKDISLWREEMAQTPMDMRKLLLPIISG
ncbi:NAD(P)/FAD-dependent oxidoreductase [Chloroflexota bacterium]